MKFTAKPLKFTLLTTLTACLVASCGGGTEETNTTVAPVSSAVEPSTDRIIVKPASSSMLTAYEARATEFAAELSSQAGVKLSPVRQMFGGGHVLQLPQSMSMSQAQVIASQLSQRADVEYAEPEHIFQAMIVPNDRLFTEQWHLREPSVAAGGTNLLDAWDITTGDPQLVMAVVDTGVLPHVDLGNRLLPGYDFITNIFSANDGSIGG